MHYNHKNRRFYNQNTILIGIHDFYRNYIRKWPGKGTQIVVTLSRATRETRFSLKRFKTLTFRGNHPRPNLHQPFCFFIRRINITYYGYIVWKPCFYQIRLTIIVNHKMNEVKFSAMVHTKEKSLQRGSPHEILDPDPMCIGATDPKTT